MTSGTRPDAIAWRDRARPDPGHRRRRLHRLPRRRRAARARAARCACSTRFLRGRAPRAAGLPRSARRADRRRRPRSGRGRPGGRGRLGGQPSGRDGRARGRPRRHRRLRLPQRPRARRCCCARCRAGFAGPFVLASSMVVYGEGRYRCTEHGSCGAAAARRPRIWTPAVRAALPALRAGADGDGGARGRAAGPAQRLRRHQGGPGAPVRRVRARDRRDGHRAALPQRLRPADAARHAVRRRGQHLPLRAGGGPGAARVRGRRAAARLRARPRRRGRQRPRARGCVAGRVQRRLGHATDGGGDGGRAGARDRRAAPRRSPASGAQATCGTCSRPPSGRPPCSGSAPRRTSRPGMREFATADLRA